MEIKNRNEVNVSNNGLLDSVKAPRNPYKEQQVNQQANQANSIAQDTVTVSSQSKTLFQASKVLEQDAAQRREKIEALKAKVQDGSYFVDSNKVASSIVSYFGDEAKVANS